MDILGLNRATRRSLIAALALAAAGAATPSLSLAATGSGAAQIDRDADAALAKLYAESPKARELADRSRAMLIFPKVVKAGFMVGAHSGNGVLRVNGKSERYYNTSAGSFGFQAGIQSYSYVLFFVSQSSLDYLERSKGWQIGSGPSVVVIDQGMARTFTTTTLTQDVYAMIFGQKGLMAGMGLEGSKITPIEP
jgi:lipid-binding SYLF domain-containing protein